MSNNSTQTKLSTADIESIAEDILRHHGIYSVPVDPIVLANKNGIKVNNATFSDDNISGIIAKRGPLSSILINESDSPFRKRFTIAHELGHHFLHIEDEGEFVDTIQDLMRDYSNASNHVDENKKMEIQANQFAAALLMPKDLVDEYYKKNNDLDFLSKCFNVSKEAMAIRLNKLNLYHEPTPTH